jgi:hypothetical protein
MAHRAVRPGVPHWQASRLKQTMTDVANPAQLTQSGHPSKKSCETTPREAASGQPVHAEALREP